MQPVYLENNPCNNITINTSSPLYYSTLVSSLLDTLDTILDTEECSFEESTWRSCVWPTDLSESVILAQIATIRAKIASIREQFRPLTKQQLDSIDTALSLLATQISSVGTYSYPSLTPAHSGVSGTYFLCDANGTPRFVVKPLDEEAGCLNNPHFFYGGNGEQNPLRDYMPLYHAPMREVLAYQLALFLGIETIAPPTVLAVIESEQFYDRAEKHEWIKPGTADREKLCSVQEYIPDAVAVWELIWSFESDENYSDEEIAARFDQKDFEKICLLIWATGDTDGHMGNILAYPKTTDASGNTIFGLKKIDNGLTFPTKNGQLRNELVYLENGNRPISKKLKSYILALDINAMAAQFALYDLGDAFPAFKKRMTTLQRLVQQPGITLREIHDQMVQL